MYVLFKCIFVDVLIYIYIYIYTYIYVYACKTNKNLGVSGNLERVVLGFFSKWVRSSGYLVNLWGK